MNPRDKLFTAVDMKKSLICMKMNVQGGTYFHMNGFARRLVLAHIVNEILRRDSSTR